MDIDDDNVVPFRPAHSVRTLVDEVMDNLPRAKGAIFFVLDEDNELHLVWTTISTRVMAAAGARLTYLSGKSWDQDD
jgi:hypothetical protein